MVTVTPWFGFSSNLTFMGDIGMLTMASLEAMLAWALWMGAVEDEVLGGCQEGCLLCVYASVEGPAAPALRRASVRVQ